MNDINLLLKVLTKDEMVEIIQWYAIPVKGFTVHLDKAPRSLLINSLKKELELGMSNRKKKRGKRYTTPDDVLKRLASKYIGDKEATSLSLESLTDKIKGKRVFSNASLLAILYLYHKEVYESHQEKIEENFEKNLFMLEGIVEERPLKDRIAEITKSILGGDIYEQQLTTLKEGIIKEIGYAMYEEIEKRVNQQDEESFFQELLSCEKGKEYVPSLPYLLYDQRYRDPKLSPLLSYLQQEIYCRIKAEKEQTDRKIAHIEEKLVQKELDLKEEKKVKDKIKKENLELRSENIKLKKQLEEKEADLVKKREKENELWKEIKEIKTIKHFFRQVMRDKQVLLVTNELDLLENNIFFDRVIDVGMLSDQIINNNLYLFEGKNVCITRVSYHSTQQWRKHANFFKNNNISYLELSGYDTDDYLEQLFEFLYKRERETAW